MDKNKIKEIIRELLKKKASFSEIQKTLYNEHGETITFMELKLLTSELEDIDWKKLNPESDKREDASPEKLPFFSKEDEQSVQEEEGTVVEISKLARPGAALSGSVKFNSGATADWVLDQFGRLRFENATGRPTPEDLRGFQEELQRKITGGT